ncbi:hypothetical protein GCM10009624_12550 [Gordonia sinesedis]
MVSTAVITLLSAGATACSLNADTQPSSIVLPPTDELSTESSTAATTTVSRVPEDAPDDLPDWSLGRVIAMAPRAENSRYHQGSTTPDGELEDTSAFHFSTPDRTVNCSTGIDDRRTLACRIGDTESPPPAGGPNPAGCDGTVRFATLDAQGPQLDMCDIQFPVLYRSSIVDFGETISVGRFSCLVTTGGVYCLESRSGSGFVATPTAFRKISAAERAPAALVGGSDSDGRPTSGVTDTPLPSDGVTPS